MLRKTGVEIEEKYQGIFYLSGRTLFPTQVIITKALSKEHPGLRILSKEAKKEDVVNFLEGTKTEKDQGDRENIDAVLQVSIDANKSLYSLVMEDKKMCAALEELMVDVIEEKERKAEDRGKKEGKKEGIREATVSNIRSMMETLKITAKQAMDALRIPESDQQNYMKML